MVVFVFVLMRGNSEWLFLSFVYEVIVYGCF